MNNDALADALDMLEQMRRANLTDREVLEAFVVDNDDLERLESLLDRFNIFEAVGMVHQELNHSAFLAFLLDPKQNHGLDDLFIKRLLQKMLVGATKTALPINLIDLDVWSLEDTLVQREWNSIDILLLNETYRFVVVIENKIRTGEHSDQLNRYYRSIEHHYPDYGIIALYLTPDGSLPSDDRYLPVGYKLITELIESLVERRASILGEDVRSLMSHYAIMLRRHIVSGSEIEELCLRIYQRHKRALDLIYEHRPDRQEDIRKILRGLVDRANALGF